MSYNRYRCSNSLYITGVSWVRELTICSCSTWAKVVVLIWAKCLYLSEIVVFWQKGCLGQKRLYLGKLVASRQVDCIYKQ